MAGLTRARQPMTGVRYVAQARAVLNERLQTGTLASLTDGWWTLLTAPFAHW
jgi:hypothetical protein